MGDTISVDYFPPIVFRVVTMTNDAVVGIACASIELRAVRQAVGLLVGAVRHRTGCSIGFFCNQLLTVKQVNLGLFASIVAWHTPSGVERDARHRDVPAYAKPSATATAAVVQRQVGLHAGASCRDD